MFKAKGRRPKFNLTLTIDNVTNVPLVSGFLFIKWEVPAFLGGISGQTDHVLIKDYTATFYYEANRIVRMSIGQDDMLEKLDIEFSVYQELHLNKERLRLGRLKLNLAEFVNKDLSSQRYLLHDSRTNSILRLSIHLELLSTNAQRFTAPEQTKTNYFGGIAGLIASEGINKSNSSSAIPHDVKSINASSDILSNNQSNESSSNIQSDDRLLLHTDKGITRRYKLAHTAIQHSLSLPTIRGHGNFGDFTTMKDLRDPQDVIDDILKGGDGFGGQSRVLPSSLHMDSDLQLDDFPVVPSWKVDIANINAIDNKIK